MAAGCSRGAASSCLPGAEALPVAPAPALLRQWSPLYSLFGALHALESGRANRASSSPGPLLGWDVSGFIYFSPQMELWIPQQETQSASWKEAAGGAGGYREGGRGGGGQGRSGGRQAIAYRSCNLSKRPHPRCEHLTCDRSRLSQGEGTLSPWKVRLTDCSIYRARGASGIHRRAPLPGGRPSDGGLSG